MSILVITGTSTGVGKTVATAVLARHARGRGLDVAVCKPVQTGTVDGDDDLAEICRLAGVVDVVGVARYSEALAPVAAADLDGASLPSLAELVAAVQALARPGRLTLVEGAGGLLVELAAGGATLRDLAMALSAPVLIVCEAGLGTLNHTALTVEALVGKGVSCAGVVIGRWPAVPGRAELSNRAALAQIAPVRAVIPDGAAAFPDAEFGAFCADAFTPDWVDGLF